MSDVDHKGTDEIAAALAKAQSKIKPPIKNRTVDFTFNNQRTKYSYADLADVIEALKIPLTESGLAVIHRMDEGESGLFMVTELLHSSGQKISSRYPLPDPTNMKAQTFGSVLTYARRYSLSMIVGIASEEDDDGQAASNNFTPKAKPAPKPPLAAISKQPTNPIKTFVPENDAPFPEEEMQEMSSSDEYGPYNELWKNHVTKDEWETLKIYKVNFGKNIGKSFTSLTANQIEATIKFFNDTLSGGKKLKPEWEDFMWHADIWKRWRSARGLKTTPSIS